MWSLASQQTWKGTRELAVTRTLTPHEGAKAVSDAQLLGWLTGHSKWNALSRRFRELETSAESSLVLDEVDQLVRKYVLAYREYGSYLDSASEWISEAECAEFTAAMRSSGFSTICDRIDSGLTRIEEPAVRLTKTEIKPGQVRTVAVLSDFMQELLGVLEIRSDDTAMAVLSKIHEAARSLQTRLLRTVSVTARHAATSLNLLAAEVVDGVPILVAGLDEGAVGGERQIKLQPLWVENISLLMSAMRAALEEPSKPAKSSNPRRRAPQKGEGLRGTPDGSEVPTDQDARPINQEADAGPVPKKTARPETAIDPGGLFLHSMAMSDRLEELWSTALSQAMSDEQVEGDLARWGTLVVSQAAALIRQEGQQAVHRWPLSVADLDSVAEMALADRLVLALVAAVEDLQRGVQAIRVPSTLKLEVDGDSARLTRWWSSGGFAAVRSRISQMLRVAEELGSVEDVPEDDGARVGVEPGLARRRSDVLLELARAAEAAALPEASVIYQIALFSILEVEGAEGSPLRVWLERPEIKTLALYLGRLATKIGSGELPSVSESALAARVGLDALSAQVGLRAELRVGGESADGLGTE